jgi:HAD superfamily hydrolase (TIGR01549 family)
MALDISRIKAFCFDVDGTLSDTDNEWVDRLVRSMSWMKFLFSTENLTRYARWLVMFTESPMNSFYHLLDYLSLDDNFARFYENRVRNHKFKKHPFWLMNGAIEILEELNPRFPLSIVSARDEMTTMLFVNNFGLQKYFQKIATSQTCEHTKPFPQPILWAASQMNVAPENCLMVGDTTVDILAGRAAGAQTVGLLCGFGTERELRRAGADLILPDLKDLLAYFPVKKS